MIDADAFSPYFVSILEESHSKDAETAAIMEMLNDLLSEQLNTDQITHICEEMLTCSEYYKNNDSNDPQELQWEHLVFRGEDDDNDSNLNGDAHPWTNETVEPSYDENEQGWVEEGGYDGEGEFGEEDVGYTEDEYYHHYDHMFTKAMEVEEILSHSDKCPSIIFSSEAIYAVLWDPYCNGDAETAAISIETAFKTASSAKPCRHMLTGKCYKKDCAFLHDVQDITCRYYLMQQGCAMMSVHDGGDCPFKHTVDVQSSPSNNALSSTVIKQQEHGIEDTTDIHNQALFPSLPTTSTSSSGGANASRSNSNNSHFYTQSEYASVLSRTQSGQGLGTGGIQLNQSSSPSSFARVGSSGGGSGGSGGGIHGSGRQGSTNLLRSDWVDSGHSVAIDYATLREQVRSLRNYNR